MVALALSAHFIVGATSFGCIIVMSAQSARRRREGLEREKFFGENGRSNYNERVIDGSH